MGVHDLAQLDWSKKQDVWVYSADPTTGCIVPGRVTRAWLTRETNELYDVVIDDGGCVRVTANHPFLCRDGVYRRADELTPGQSLMPLYRKLSSLDDGDFQNGYEKVLDNESGSWVYTHRLVANAGFVADDSSRLNEHSYVVHHVNHNKRDNSPNNLIKMGKRAHALYHATQAKNLLADYSRDRLRAVMRTDQYKAKHKVGVKRAWDVDDGSRRLNVAMNNAKHKQKNVDLAAARAVANTCENRNEFYRKIGLTYTGFRNACKRQGVNHGEWLTSVFGNKKLGIKRNHCVVSVTKVVLDKPVPVYDLEVENWHNFAVDTGVAGGSIIVHNSKATLAQEDIRFSRTINVIQRTMLAELNKLAIIHLYAHGYDGEDLQNFTLRLSNPSSVAQQQKLELWRAKFEIAGSRPEGVVSNEFIMKEIWNLDDDKIQKIMQQQIDEKIFATKLESAGAGGEGEAGGGEDLFGGDLGGAGGGGGGDAGEVTPEETGGGEEETPPEENAGEEPEEEADPGVQLLTSGDEEDDRFLQLASDNDGPAIKPQNQLDKALYNRGRRRTHGASKTHFPDFVKMTGNDSESMKDPTDSGWMKSVVSNPLGESYIEKPSSRFNGLSPDMYATLRKMSEKLGISKRSSVLLEGVDVQDEIDVSLKDNETDLGDDWDISDE